VEHPQRLKDDLLSVKARGGQPARYRPRKTEREADGTWGLQDIPLNSPQNPKQCKGENLQGSRPGKTPFLLSLVHDIPAHGGGPSVRNCPKVKVRSVQQAKWGPPKDSGWCPSELQSSCPAGGTRGSRAGWVVINTEGKVYKAPSPATPFFLRKGDLFCKLTGSMCWLQCV